MHFQKFEVHCRHMQEPADYYREKVPKSVTKRDTSLYHLSCDQAYEVPHGYHLTLS